MPARVRRGLRSWRQSPSLTVAARSVGQPGRGSAPTDGPRDRLGSAGAADDTSGDGSASDRARIDGHATGDGHPDRDGRAGPDCHPDPDRHADGNSHADRDGHAVW